MVDEPIKPRKRGRPKKVIISLDYFKISELASLEWSNAEIAKSLGMAEKEFDNRLDWDTRLIDALSKKDAPIDYNYVNYLARDHCSNAEIARKIHLSHKQFYERLKIDAALQDALNIGRNDYLIALRHSKKQSWQPQFITICRECGFLMDGKEAVKDEEGNVIDSRLPIACKKCGSKDLKYEREGASVTAQIWESKQHLGESDKAEVTHSGDPTNPLNVSIESADERMARYKKYFESQENENELNQTSDSVSRGDGSGQPLQQTETHS